MQSEEAAITPHWLTRQGISPLQFGLSFLILVGIPLTLWSLYADKNMPAEDYGVLYVTYLQNVSWSLSLLVIFPLFLGLSLYFYNTYPGVLQYLYNTTATAPDKAIFHNLCKKIDRSVNNKIIPIAAFLVSIIFTAYIYINYLSICDVYSWMTNGPYLTNFSTCGDYPIKGFTNRGVVAFIIQVMLTTWILIFAIRSLLFIRGLFDLFNSKETNVRLDPFHPDGVSGLTKLSQLATLQAMMLFSLGIYVSLKVIDRIYFQQISIFDGIGNTVAIVSYVVIAPTVFFLILGSAYHKMLEAKESVISILCDKVKDVLIQIKAESDYAENKKKLEYLKNLEEQKTSLQKSILVWPFNVKSIQGFFSAVLTPLIAPLITGAMELYNFINKL
jgi:hypothetical protein